MEHEEIKVIIQYLTILELPLDKPISNEIVKSQYRKLVHVYHPDASVDVYHDGERFKLLQKAYEYLSSDILFVNNLISNNFQNSYSFNSSYSNGFEKSRKEPQTYHPTQTYSNKASRKSEFIFSNDFAKTKNFHFYSSCIGILFALLIFFFGLMPYASEGNYEGTYPTGSFVWHTYNLYQSSADTYGVYHCAIAFNFVLIVLLLLNSWFSFFQKKNEPSTLISALLRLLLNFVIFGLAIPQAVFHMIVSGGGLYSNGEAGSVVLTVFTWLIIALYLIKTVTSFVPIVKYVLSKIKG